MHRSNNVRPLRYSNVTSLCHATINSQNKLNAEIMKFISLPRKLNFENTSHEPVKASVVKTSVRDFACVTVKLALSKML